MGSTREARREGRREAAVATISTSRMTATSVGKSVGETPVEKAGKETSGGNCQGKAGEAAREADAQSLPDKSFNDLAA